MSLAVWLQTCQWRATGKTSRPLGIQPETSLSRPSCKNTNGSIWLPSLPIIIEISLSRQRQRWLSWLADWFPITKIYMSSSNGACYWRDCRRRGGKLKKKKRSQAAAEKGGWAARKAELTNRKAPSVFISVTLGCLVISLLHAKQSASAAEGGQRGKKEGKIAPRATTRDWRLWQMAVLTDCEKNKSLDGWNRSCQRCTNTIVRPSDDN